MSGCAHAKGMDLCARIDYVGIGWFVKHYIAPGSGLSIFGRLISASVGTVVHYGFQCHPAMGKTFLLCCFLTGLAGNIFPFQGWFNDPTYRVCHLHFFCRGRSDALAIALAYCVLPLSRFYIRGTDRSSLVPPFAQAGQALPRYAFFLLPLSNSLHNHCVDPIWPSLASYLAGLAFYATRFPERSLSKRYSHYLDWCGGGSHAIWHGFIVLAIKLHRDAMASMRNGIQCQAL